MARIRTIKPDFWRNEDLSSVSAEAALLALGLLNHADDDGYFNANPKLIESDVFPLRELSSSVPALLHELEYIGYLKLYSGSDGKRYGLITNFAKHQVINKPSPSKISGLCLIPYDSGSDPVVLRVGKERKGRELEGKGKPFPATRVADDEDSRFDLFWSAYDKKVGKANATKEWKKLSPSDDLVERIVAQASLYAKSNDKKYRKDPERWLKARGWEDEIVQPARASGDGLTDYQRSMRDRVDALTGGRASAKPLGSSMPLGNVIDVTPLNRKLGGE